MPFAVFGNHPYPATHGERGMAQPSRFAIHVNASGNESVEAEQRFRNRGASRANQAGHAEYFTRMQRERDVFELAGAREVLDTQQLLAGFGLQVSGEIRVQRAAD